MRVLITGASGQLGRDLQLALAAHETFTFAHQELDVTDAEAVGTAIAGCRPEVIVHTAALTDTARCEREPTFAYDVNANGAANVARACRSAGASMAHVSTNEVFDGAKAEPYVEDDPARAINAYGRSKLEGERLVQEALVQHFVVRTAWLYGAGGNNFPTKVLRAADGGALTGVVDEIATPTSTRDLAEAISSLIETAAYGIYHLTNTGEASRYDWTREILRLAGRADVPVRTATAAEFRASLAPDAVVPEKPPYSVLANRRAAGLGIRLRPWQEALADYIATIGR